MKCPNCGTENAENNSFCLECGARLEEKKMDNRSMWRKKLTIEAFRVILFIFVLLILNSLFIDMNFLQDLANRLPKINLLLIIKTILNFAIIIVILGFAKFIGIFWPKSFPKFFQAAFFIKLAIYLIALTIFYNSTIWAIQQYIMDSNVIFLYQILFGLVAVILLIRAFVELYQVLPIWLQNIDENFNTNIHSDSQEENEK
jgi:transcription initiation factor TFIIIB Brf1 subunit/transcription initiation factor TFIIB